jgi:hypothetical protein
VNQMGSTGSVVCLYNHGNGVSCFLEGAEFLYLKKGSNSQNYYIVIFF